MHPNSIVEFSLAGMLQNWMNQFGFDPSVSPSQIFRPLLTLSSALRGLILFLPWMMLAPSISCSGQETPKVLFEDDFEKAEVGSTPDTLMVIDGGFVVKEGAGGKYLELPGAPLDSFAVLFGPNRKENLKVSADIFGTGKGRRFPVFGVGLCGVGGYRFQVVPSKRQVELRKGDTVLTNMPATWVSGKWMRMELSLSASQPGEWILKGKGFYSRESASADLELTTVIKETPGSGQASIWGMPYSEQPILFDHLRVVEFSEKSSPAK